MLESINSLSLRYSDTGVDVVHDHVWCLLGWKEDTVEGVMSNREYFSAEEGSIDLLLSTTGSGGEVDTGGCGIVCREDKTGVAHKSGFGDDGLAKLRRSLVEAW